MVCSNQPHMLEMITAADMRYNAGTKAERLAADTPWIRGYK
jgi:hypothetical protein